MGGPEISGPLPVRGLDHAVLPAEVRGGCSPESWRPGKRQPVERQPKKRQDQPRLEGKDKKFQPCNYQAQFRSIQGR